MATQAAEVIFAQKLAANERSVRSKALLKLRKYIRIRSERAPGGFSEEELLKIWKGLFYCLWMQDLPVLQEELSTKISALLFSFRTVDSQFLFFKTFLQTIKREWNGIDRLRLDKFYQLVRFVFRQMFEMLKKQEWEPSVLQVFLQLFSDQLLQSSSAAPSGLTLHIMELYMTELAAVGAAELTAEQNLSLIEPFCRTMSKTRDRVLLKAIGSSIFSTIVDQVPFAIADLLREIGTTEDEDQDGESSGETQTNVSEENTSHPGDLEDKGSAEAVLQFDYGAVADRLFEVASHSNIPSFNRSQIYKFVKVFRDLSEGVFPQDEVEDVSSDEDEFDDDRRRKKKKKSSGRQQDSLNTHTGEAEASRPEDNKPKNNNKKKRRKKKKKSGLKSVEEPENCATPQTPAEDQKKKTQHTATADGGQQRSETHTTAMEEDGGATAEKPQKKKRKMQTPAGADEHTLMKRRKKSLHTHANGDAQIEKTTVEKPQKKKKIQKPLNGHTQLTAQKKKKMMQIADTHTQLTTETPQKKKKLSQKRAAAVLVNGHTEAKDPALPVSTDRKMKKKFVLSQKKAPAPLFCKGLKNTRISAAAKTDRKKVTFGLKNNKTVEFRKSDRSALLSPDRLPFDPSRAPKSGVLKSPSPSSLKRPSAADFF